MNYFKLTLDTEWCGMEQEIFIKSELNYEELSRKYEGDFDDMSFENLISHMNEEQIIEEGYDVDDAHNWFLTQIEFDGGDEDTEWETYS